MAAGAPSHPNAKRIASPAVRERIRAVIGNRVQRTDADDVTQKVYVRLLLLMEELPGSDDELLGLVTTVTEGKIVDHFRRATVDEARHADEEEAHAIPEAAAVPSLQKRAEWKRLLEFAQKMEDRGLVDAVFLRVAARLAQGDTYDEIAADERIEPAALRKRMERDRKKLMARWAAVTGLSGAVLAAALALFNRPSKPEITAPQEAYSAPTATTTAEAVETPAQKAAQLRKDAHAACEATDVRECEQLLDQARELDPTSEEQHDVIQMRHFIAEAKKHGLK